VVDDWKGAALRHMARLQKQLDETRESLRVSELQQRQDAAKDDAATPMLFELPGQDGSDSSTCAPTSSLQSRLDTRLDAEPTTPKIQALGLRTDYSEPKRARPERGYLYREASSVTGDKWCMSRHPHGNGVVEPTKGFSEPAPPKRRGLSWAASKLIPTARRASSHSRAPPAFSHIA